MNAARELRDRYLEQFNSGLVLANGKYEVGRHIESTPQRAREHIPVAPSVPIGVGIGVPKEGSSVCSLATSMVTTAESTPSLSAAVDAGSYCVQVFDAGYLTDSDVAFSISITSPSITSTP